jgi:c-di-GMP-binding flagellar brake protein YcgR
MMVIFMELFFIAILIAILVALIKTERISLKAFIPRAKVEEYWDGKERRRHFRFNKVLEVDYRVEKKPRLKRCRTVDISEGGLKLLLDDKLAKGTFLDIEINLPGSKKAAELEGEVVWLDDADIKDSSGKRYFYAGIKFLAVKEPTGQHLMDYIKSLSLEPTI